MGRVDGRCATIGVHNGYMTTYGTAESLLVETYGLRLLAYLCGVSTDDMQSRLGTGRPLSNAAAERVLSRDLIGLAQIIAANYADNPNLPAALRLEVLGATVPDEDVNIGNKLRLSAGGELFEVSAHRVASDPVKAPLAKLARDQYLFRLAPSDDRYMPMMPSMFRHPARSEFESALAADAALSKLVPDDDPGLGKRGYLYTSAGRAYGVQSVGVGEMIIGSAWDWASMDSASPSLEAWVDQIDEQVEMLRKLVVGQEVSIRALLVFTGVTLPEGYESIGTPWGPLRRLNEVERAVVPSGLEGSVMTSYRDDKSVTVAYAGELVLDTMLSFNITVAPEGLLTSTEPKWPSLRSSDALRRRQEGVQLAVLFSAHPPEGSWATARLSWYWLADPLSLGRSMGWSTAQQFTGLLPYELTTGECDDVARWTATIDERWSSRIDIAVRRVLSAAQARTEPADRIVDAVISWENLFGTSEGEPRLRISAAMAWLLESDSNARLALQGILKSLYDLRSKIVHGGDYDQRTVGEPANDAVSFAIRALVELFDRRPDILRLKDGSARSLRLILGS